MEVTIQILDADLDTFETSNSRCQGLVPQALGCVENLNSARDSNVMHPTKSMSKFTIMFHFVLTDDTSC